MSLVIELINHDMNMWFSAFHVRNFGSSLVSITGAIVILASATEKHHNRLGPLEVVLAVEFVASDEGGSVIDSALRYKFELTRLHCRWLNAKRTRGSFPAKFRRGDVEGIGIRRRIWKRRRGANGGDGVGDEAWRDAGSEAARQARRGISYGESKLEVTVSSRATFRELKKQLEAEIGLRQAEQKIRYRGKERENGEFLDICGVKDRSKLVVMEDPFSRERRYIEMRRNAKIQSASLAIANLSLEVDKLAAQVSAIEKSISSRKKVPELQITMLIELLMRQAVTLDAIIAEGEVRFQKNLQAKRVQKFVETLDELKLSNGKLKPVIVTTNWETFDPPSTTRLGFF
ncbi:BAG family molecular chaperone regulator 3-like [Phalaenopsis equestris]|uniref:BAG family molecular chaperone regulator 3-like n=1 Tax=Phalaenopsis equestris TaxID=78828 RepID=UPI0009E24313|nr:BAG family molecular chaperone regulator 3-like [Phalaenopsis equestris]